MAQSANSDPAPCHTPRKQPLGSLYLCEQTFRITHWLMFALGVPAWVTPVQVAPFVTITRADRHISDTEVTVEEVGEDS